MSKMSSAYYNSGLPDTHLTLTTANYAKMCKIRKCPPLLNYYTTNCPLQICSCLPRTRFFNIFKFLKSRNLKSASFSLLGNLITCLHLKFFSKLWKNYKNIAFCGRLAANCTLMADSVRVAQPIRLQHLH